MIPFARRVNSAASRDLPTPGGAITSATRTVDPSTARLRDRRSAASSRLRPTSGASSAALECRRDRLELDEPVCAYGSRLPLISRARRAARARPRGRSAGLRARRSRSRRWRLPARAVRRSPTASPVTSRCRASVGVATTSPVSIPIRTSSPTPCSWSELLVERGDPCPDVERGARRAERVVLVRDRDPERGHDRVARVLLDRASVARERRRHGLEVALQDSAERLRVERRRERHRLDDVDEEDRDEPPELHRRHGERSLLEQQRLILAQDCGLDCLELRPGVDAELLDQRLGARRGRQRARRPAGRSGRARA